MELPQAFIERIQKLLGEQAPAFFEALSDVPPISVRMNPDKLTDNSYFLESTQVPWSSCGRYLKARPAFTFDPLLHAGGYYVQEASSMFVEQAFNVAIHSIDSTELRVLDLCAAPGGKSTLLASLLPKDGLLISNELIRTRANILSENLIKWGNANFLVTQSDPSSFTKLKDAFDVILTDVPCSGEGMFRKDPESIQEWSIDNVKLCANRQQEILKSIWPTLKSGGCLIYSTCTYNLIENEENVAWICEELGGTLMDIPIDKEWQISGAQGHFSNVKDFPVYRFFPHKTVGEGFFLALIKKDADDESYEKIESKVKKSLGKSRDNRFDTPKTWIKNEERFEFFLNRIGHVAAFPRKHFDFFQKLSEHLRIVHAGIVVGESKGKDMIPDASLALAVNVDKTQFKCFDLGKKQAINFLRREAFVFGDDCPLGWVLICYEGHPLGWIKNIGNRANNNYPNEWRIRSDNPF